MLEGFLYLSFLQLDFLGCEDCENFGADPHNDKPVCEMCNMKEGCKKLLAGLRYEVYDEIAPFGKAEYELLKSKKV
jgi:hypothetical protein